MPLRNALKHGLTAHISDRLKAFSHYEELDAGNKNKKMFADVQKAWKGFVKSKINDSGGIAGVITASKQQLFVEKVEFDTNRLLLGCENGVIDLDKGVFRPYTFEDRITLCTNVTFIPTITAIRDSQDNIIATFKVMNEEGELEEVDT